MCKLWCERGIRNIIFTSICHNLTLVNKRARKREKRKCTFEKTTELFW